MDADSEIRALAAETLAIQTIVGQTLFHLARADPRIADAIRQALDDSANIVEQIAIQFGSKASPDHTVKALKIVEEVRTIVLGRGNKPRDAI
jgi:hypothetical protein